MMLAAAGLLWGLWSYGWNALTTLPTRGEIRSASAEVSEIVARRPAPPPEPARPAPPEPVPGTEGSRVRFVEQDGIVGVRIDGPLERAPATAKPSPEPPPPPETADVYRLVVIEAAGVIDARSHKIRLAHVNAPAVTETCARPDGSAWPCGIRARTAMRKLIRRRAISCFDVKPVDPAASPRPAVCEVGGTDLSEWLVAQGWAEPAGTAPDAWRALNETAKAERKGIYSGDARLELAPAITR